MSPRPRKATDDQVFEAATKVMSRMGPGQITLAAIAEEAGLTAGALVQRFGSKRALLFALLERFADGAPSMFAALRADASSPLAAIRAYGRCMAAMGTTPEALANSLSWLQQDMTDPDFRRFTLANALGTRRELQRLVEEAIAKHELGRGVTPAALARAIEVTVAGSLMTWALYQEGSAASWVRHDLEALLKPYVRTRR